jgi:hypothetical protein
VTDVQTILARAEAALVSDDLADARDAYESVLALDPANLVARRGVWEVTRELFVRASRAGLTKQSRVRVAVDLKELADGVYDEEEHDVVSVLACRGPVQITDLAGLTGLTEPAMLEAVTSLVERGFVRA